jgi:hypothetical protein
VEGGKWKVEGELKNHGGGVAVKKRYQNRGLEYYDSMSEQMNSHQPKHLNSHHLDTVMKIFAHPTSHNIRWEEVMSLIGEIGSVEEKHDGKVKHQVAAVKAALHGPKHRIVQGSIGRWGPSPLPGEWLEDSTRRP